MCAKKSVHGVICGLLVLFSGVIQAGCQKERLAFKAQGGVKEGNV